MCEFKDDSVCSFPVVLSSVGCFPHRHVLPIESSGDLREGSAALGGGRLPLSTQPPPLLTFQLPPQLGETTGSLWVLHALGLAVS